MAAVKTPAAGLDLATARQHLKNALLDGGATAALRDQIAGLEAAAVQRDAEAAAAAAVVRAALDEALAAGAAMQAAGARSALSDRIAALQLPSAHPLT